MRRSAKGLIGYTIRATDGEIGAVEDFYFDDHAWTVRYLVVNTGGWLSGRRVLISPVALGNPDWASWTFPVTLTMDQVRNSPDIDTNKPVSRQHEDELYTYYAWTPYWLGGPFIGGAYGCAPLPCAGAQAPSQEGMDVTAQRPKGDPHLRSMWKVTGYGMHAKDGEIGHVVDFILDDVEWDIRYLVVDTRNWLPGRKVLVTPVWITRVNWDESKVFTALTREAVKNSPEYDPSHLLTMDYEGKLCDWYGRPK